MKMRVPILQSRPVQHGASDASGEPRTGDIQMSLNPVRAADGSPALLATVVPPKSPTNQSHHVPCDIVLVIDVSGSMGCPAPVPGDNEASGLSVLDVVKHASLTIIETLDERDRLGIVTFASSIEVLQELEVMTDEKKEAARANIKSMVPKDATNLWHGILAGINLFTNSPSNGKVPAIMVLTDGMPNHMCPPQGYVPKLRTKLPLPASIHTFGFGYHLRSGLLKSIAEIGNGNYAFIPDAGMIGTVFVHAVANLQSTYATEATLTLRYAGPLEITESTGDSVIRQKPTGVSRDGISAYELPIALGNLQYGQSRDIFLHIQNSKLVADFVSSGITTASVIEARLRFKPVEYRTSDQFDSLTCSQSIMEASTEDEAAVAYHESRSRICAYLSSLFPCDDKEEHTAIGIDLLGKSSRALKELVDTLPARSWQDPLNASLMEDLVGQDPKGQISMAIDDNSHFSRWGQHFLPSLLNAHTRQVCNSFKDPGPLQYCTGSPLFIECRDRLDAAFDNLPPPQPSLVPGNSFNSGGNFQPMRSMKQFRNVAGPCFAASSPVELASGRVVEIKRLRRGMKVRTPAGMRKVAAVLKTPVCEAKLCRMGNVLVTPWHPMTRDGKTWQFPEQMTKKTVRYTGAIYSIMLQMDGNPEAHALRFGSMWGVTLGHGITTGSDVRAHAFLGDYSLVGKGLANIGMDRRGVVIGSGVVKDPYTGLICGFVGRDALGISSSPCTISSELKLRRLIRA